MTAPVIVICDDEAELVSELAEWFEARGWAVHKAYSADEALLLLGEEGRRTTCLVTDKLMPVWSGDALAQHLSTLPLDNRPDLVAVMTGDFSIEDTPRPGGVDAVFIKPVDPNEILSAITQQLKTRVARKPPLALSNAS
ncbi:MAG: response regulator [Devosia sp.]|nr:response regulator [Devosia sp.]